jgi:nicotinamidase/pyrazinamidase
MKTVFFDVDTQLDFVLPAGSLYVPRAEGRISTFARLAEYALSNGIPLVSTMDAHTEDDPEFRLWPHHCVRGALGQRKAIPPAAQAVTVTLAGPCPDARNAPQIVVEKVTVDCFTNPHLRTILGQLAAERYVVFGVVTEICVRHALDGLLATGAKVEVVSDAIQHIDVRAADRMLARFQAAGGEISTSFA